MLTAAPMPIHALQATANPAPQLVVLRQNSLAEDKLVKNGHTKHYHIVVKNSPFLIQLGLSNRAGGYFGKADLNLNQFAFEGRLYYDVDPEKEVSWVKEKPMECKITINEHQPGLINAEVRLKVLSTQHEDLFFKVKFFAIEKATRREIFQACSSPIKVISKSDQVKKKKEPKPKKKRSATDMLMETLCKIEKRQQEHCEILYKLLGQPAPAPSQSLLEGIDFNNIEVEDIDFDDEVDMGQIFSEGVQAAPSLVKPVSPVQIPQPIELVDSRSQKRSKAGCEGDQDLAQAFRTFMHAFQAVPQEQRAQELRKAVNTQSPAATMELMDMLQTEGLQREPQAIPTQPHNHDCQCGECPYKAELSRVEEFYRDVFSLTNPVHGLDPMYFSDSSPLQPL